MDSRLRTICDLSVPTVRGEAGLHEYDGVVQDLSLQGVRAGLDRLGGPVANHDEAHLAAFEAGLRVSFGEVELHRRDPYLHLANLELSGYDREYAPAAERAAARTRHLRQWPEAVDTAVGALDRLSAPVASALLDAVRGLGADVRGDDGEVGRVALNAHARLVRHVETAAKTGDPDAALGAAALARLMGAADAVEVDLGRLADQADAERDRLTVMLREACAAYDPRRSVREILPDLLADHPDADGVLDDARAQAAEAIAFTRTHQLTPYLDGECAVGVPPESRRWVKAMMTWAGPGEADTVSWYHITPPEPSWPAQDIEQWLTVFSRTSLPAITVHEVAPGHFAHGRALRRLASPVRRTLHSLAFMEGWAHYTEEVCVELGFRDGDPRFAIGVALEALVRVTRLACAIGLHTGAMTVTDATERFIADAHLGRAGAASEARRGTFDATYGRYTVGKLAIQDLRDRARIRWGRNFTLPQFHRKLLALGCPPLGLVNAVLDGPAGENPTSESAWTAGPE